MNRRDFLGLTAAFAAAGCTTTETKKVDAVTSATPVVPWKPFPNAKKVRVVQWGMCHEHADGKFKSVKKLPDDYELVGIIDDRESKTPREDRNFKVFDGVPRMTPEQLWADKSIQCVFVEVTNDDLIPIAWKVAKHGLAMHLDKPCGQNLKKFEALMDFCKARGIPVQIGYMFRVNPAIKFATKAVKEGWLGDIISVEADMYHDYGSKNYNAYIASFKGGIMYNLGCHLVDFILPMMPGMPTKAHVVRLPAPGDPDNAGTNCVSVLEWPHATVTVRSSRHAGCSSRWLRIQGTKGAIDLRPIERFDGKPTTLELRLKEAVGGYKKGMQTVDCGVQKDRYADQLKELADIIRGIRPNPAGQYEHDVAVHKVTLMACGML
ncbi:MAG: Gfo/Idh/MocA family oxidoreductase [bacterium]|nr:Gfo/Idh/MocA family oxidoreductase [bacterium]